MTPKISWTTNPDNIQPTKENMIQKMFELVDGAVTGDSFFFRFSGHTTQEDSDSPNEEDRKDKFIISSAYIPSFPRCMTPPSILLVSHFVLATSTPKILLSSILIHLPASISGVIEWDHWEVFWHPRNILHLKISPFHSQPSSCGMMNPNHPQNIRDQATFHFSHTPVHLRTWSRAVRPDLFRIYYCPRNLAAAQ